RSKIIERFHELHEQNYSFKLLDTTTEIVNFHLTGFGKVDKIKLSKIESSLEEEEPLIETRKVYFEDVGWLDTDIYQRELLQPGIKIDGPTIIEEKQTSTLVYPGQNIT